MIWFAGSRGINPGQLDVASYRTSTTTKAFWGRGRTFAITQENFYSRFLISTPPSVSPAVEIHWHLNTQMHRHSERLSCLVPGMS